MPFVDFALVEMGQSDGGDGPLVEVRRRSSSDAAGGDDGVPFYLEAKRRRCGRPAE